MFRHKKRSTNGGDKSRPSRAGTSGDVDSRTGVLPDGSCLAGAKAAAFAGATVDCHWEASPPRFDGTLEAFAAAHATEAALVAQLRNIVKKCSCGKVCGFSLTECNACGKPLPAETSHSPNVFSGFIYGIASAPFPLHISIRRQSAQLLVFDDLLALTPCHLNAVPTSAYSARAVAPAWQVGCGLAHMHALGVTHRDVKPENVIFVDRQRQTVRLVDFGFATNHKVGPHRHTPWDPPSHTPWDTP